MENNVSKMQQQVLEFHKTYGLPASSEPTLIPFNRYDLRRKLMQEELDEYVEACGSNDLIEVADAIGDLLYFVFGTAIEHGINMQPVVDEIQRSNMSKLGLDGKPIYREDGKVLKGPNFFKPRITTSMMRYKDDLSEILLHYNQGGDCEIQDTERNA